MNKSGVAGQVISLPRGGGAISGLGDTFAPDLHTGTGNLSVPIALPPGRNGFQPDVSLQYSTGQGNGPFGLGWQLGVPGIARDTKHGVPRYLDETDTFLLSGAEQLVPVGTSPDGVTRYRPRIDSAFARIERRTSDRDDYWEVWSRNGLRSTYGHRGRRGADPSAVRDPDHVLSVFRWNLTETVDTFGNRIEYLYARDPDADAGLARRDQLYIDTIRYADHGPRDDPRFLVTVSFVYEPRPDAFSTCMPGFEVRTTRRCSRIEIRTHAHTSQLTRVVRLIYQDDPSSAAANGVSLLRRIEVEGVDGDARELLPPLEFTYTSFDPSRRRYRAMSAIGGAVPDRSLAHPDFELADLFGRGLPDVVQIGDVNRYWKNLGDGRFDIPRPIEALPAVLRLGDPGTQLADMDGDGHVDVLVSQPALSGYFPLTADASAGTRPFVFNDGPQPFRGDDPELRLVDLDGDGVTDALRTGADFELFFHDRAAGWTRAERRTRGDFNRFPDVFFSDPRVKLADMNGDGLQDIVFVGQGHADYWPSLGHGRWGPRVSMAGRLEFRDAPTLGGLGFDPTRLLLGDVDGDGLADLVYVESGRVTIWLNQSGNGWSAPILVHGTPPVSDVDAVRLADMLGHGTDGVLWTYDHQTFADSTYKFLDLTGGVKPYLLSERINNTGARSRVTYASSTRFRVEDDRHPEARWQGRLPFPVPVVSRVDSIDEISGGTLTTEYRYHQGYWDGNEREFRGFGLVEQIDTEWFFRPSPPAADPESFAATEAPRYSPPLLTRTWFHQGEVQDSDGSWQESALRPAPWPEDPQIFTPQRRTELSAIASAASSAGDATRLRYALRALKGTTRRVEIYALDDSPRRDRPFTVVETIHDVRNTAPSVFFPFPFATRTTHWDRGSDPMTEFTFTDGHDEYGLPRSRLAVAVPRGRDPLVSDSGATEPHLATFTVTEYARRDAADAYVVDRGARATGYEVVNDGAPGVFALRSAVLDGTATLRVIAHERHHYDGDAFVGLPLGQIGAFGALVRSESLVFTDEFLAATFDPADPLAVGPRPVYLSDTQPPAWTPEYPEGFRAALPALAGYVHYAADAVAGSPAGYYSTSAAQKYDFHEPGAVPRGMPRVIRDPLGTEASVEHDPFDLLAARATDAVGLTSTAEYDYRTMQVRLAVEPNGNTSEFRYSPAGFLIAQFLRDKDGRGDAAHPTLRFEYDLLAFAHDRRPIFVRTIRRAHHDGEADVPSAERDATLESVEYSDGFGRVLQTRAQADDTTFGDPAFGGSVLGLDPNSPSQAVAGRVRPDGSAASVSVSGAVTYDNKGQPVEKYEPYFDTGWDYVPPLDEQHRQKSVMFYDARGRLVRTVNPDGSQQLAVFGVPSDLSDPSSYVPTPWEIHAYDAHDNAGRTHGAAASAFAHHWNTPSSVVVDALGRTVSTLTRNGPDPATDWLSTRSVHDIQGNLISAIDPFGRTAFRYVFDLEKRQWRVDSIDGGRRDVVRDVMGKVVEARDAKGALTLKGYDVVHRPVAVWARDHATGRLTLRQRMRYGDGGRHDQPAPDRESARARNLLGQLASRHDEAGVVATLSIDFKGNVLETSRRVIADDPMLAVLASGPASGWQIDAFTVDWEPAPQQTLADLEAALLDDADYRTESTYDALNRVKLTRLPLDVEGRRRAIRTTYRESGRIDRIVLDDTVFVERVVHDAKGQRALIVYGNGVMTRYAYDPRTFRLGRLRSERVTETTPQTYVPAGPALQDLLYSHDLTGNILGIEDRTPGSGVANNPDALLASDPGLAQLLASGDALVRRFTYDPMYRLRSATGRECDSPPPDDPPFLDRPRCADHTRARTYLETYDYDAAGGIHRLAHQSGTDGFVRVFTVNPADNALRAVQVGQSTFDYAFDPAGNMLRETTSRHFEWSHANHMTVFRTQTAGVEPSVYAQYLYDAAGQRVKKLVRRQGGHVEATHYVDGLFEHHRWTTAGSGANNHVHVSDDARRVALMRVGPAHPADPAPPVQFQLPDHTGSAVLLVDAAGAALSREDFTPYGETSFGTFARKRFRFCGMERDEESSLSYHGARYYAPGLARWTSADPAGLAGGGNLFTYAADNPMMLVDPGGMEPESIDLPQDAEGNYWLGEQIIEIHDVAPPKDVYQATHEAGTTNIRWMDEWERQRNAQRYPAGRKRTLYDDVAESMWILDYEGTAAIYYGERNKAYDDYRRGLDVELGKGFRRTDFAANITKGVGVGVALVVGIGGGSILAGGFVPFVKQVGWSMLFAGSTSQGGYGGCGTLAGLGGGPGAGGGAALEASLAERALQRAVATRTQARTLGEGVTVTRTLESATGAETFTHTTMRAAAPRTQQSAAVEIVESRTLNLSPGGERGQWGQGAYAYEGAVAGDAVAVQFSVPPGTAIERITVSGSETIVRLVPAEGNTLAIVNPVHNLTAAEVTDALELIRFLSTLK